MSESQCSENKNLLDPEPERTSCTLDGGPKQRRVLLRQEEIIEDDDAVTDEFDDTFHRSVLQSNDNRVTEEKLDALIESLTKFASNMASSPSNSDKSLSEKDYEDDAIDDISTTEKGAINATKMDSNLNTEDTVPHYGYTDSINHGSNVSDSISLDKNIEDSSVNTDDSNTQSENTTGSVTLGGNSDNSLPHCGTIDICATSAFSGNTDDSIARSGNIDNSMSGSENNDHSDDTRGYIDDGIALNGNYEDSITQSINVDNSVAGGGNGSNTVSGNTDDSSTNDTNSRCGNSDESLTYNRHTDDSNTRDESTEDSINCVNNSDSISRCENINDTIIRSENSLQPNEQSNSAENEFIGSDLHDASKTRSPGEHNQSFMLAVQPTSKLTENGKDDYSPRSNSSATNSQQNNKISISTQDDKTPSNPSIYSENEYDLDFKTSTGEPLVPAKCAKDSTTELDLDNEISACPCNDYIEYNTKAQTTSPSVDQQPNDNLSADECKNDPSGDMSAVNVTNNNGTKEDIFDFHDKITDTENNDQPIPKTLTIQNNVKNSSLPNEIAIACGVNDINKTQEDNMKHEPLSPIPEDDVKNNDETSIIEQPNEGMRQKMKLLANKNHLPYKLNSATKIVDGEKKADTPITPSLDLPYIDGSHSPTNLKGAVDYKHNGKAPCANFVNDDKHSPTITPSSIEINANTSEESDKTKEAISDILTEINCLSSGDDSVFETTDVSSNPKSTPSESESVHTTPTTKELPVIKTTNDVEDTLKPSYDSLESKTQSFKDSAYSPDKDSLDEYQMENKEMPESEYIPTPPNTQDIPAIKTTNGSYDKLKNSNDSLEPKRQYSKDSAASSPNKDSLDEYQQEYEGSSCDLEESAKLLPENERNSASSKSDVTDTEHANGVFKADTIPKAKRSKHSEISNGSKERPKSGISNAVSRFFQMFPFHREKEDKLKSSHATSEGLTQSSVLPIKFYSLSDDHNRDRGLSLSPEERDLNELFAFKRDYQQNDAEAEGGQANIAFESETTDSETEDLVKVLTDLSEQLKNIQTLSEINDEQEGTKSIKKIKSDLLENLILLQNKINPSVDEVDSIDEEIDDFPVVTVTNGAMQLARQTVDTDPERPLIQPNEEDNLSLEFFVPGSKKTFRLHRRTFITFVVKYSIFMFSFLFWFCSLSVMCFGAWMLANESAIVIDDVSDVFLDPYALLCMVSGIIFIVAFFGCVGALRENICLLRIFHLALGFVLCLEILVGALVFLFFTLPEFRQAVKVGPEEVLKNAVVHYFDDEGMQRWIDKLQKEFGCCGASLSDDGYLDWQENAYFNCSSPSVYRCSVPLSCCIFEKRDYINYMCGADIIRREESYVKRYINTKGCMKSLGEWLADNTSIIAYITAGVIIPQILSIVAARYFNTILARYTRDITTEEVTVDGHSSCHDELNIEQEARSREPSPAPDRPQRTWRRLSAASKALFQTELKRARRQNI